MSVCNGCGFISYPSLWKSEEELKEHYRKDYRQPPTHSNLYTGQRKIYFHNAFLQDVFAEWKGKGKSNPAVFEIGAAYGMALHWIKNAYKGAEVYGTELTTSYRLNALHEFGIKLTEDFDFSRKYDLIMSYKVAEHQTDVDQHLRKYVEALTDDGYMYISVPTWLDTMCNFGLGGFDIEYYYDTNHINSWTRKLFESLLKKVGLEIVKKDTKIYDSTYLCKRNDALMSEPREFEDPVKIKEDLAKIKAAYLACTDGHFDKAISIWPDYPTAHINKAEANRKQIFENNWEWIKENIINKMFSDCPNASESFVLACDFAMRAGEFQDAIKYAEAGLQHKPENPAHLLQLINIMRELGIRAAKANNEKAKVHFFKQAREIARHLRSVSQQNFTNATDFIYFFNAQIPEETNATA